MKFLRGQMITLQNLEPVRDEEKRGFVGLTEIINSKNFFRGDELIGIVASTLNAVRRRMSPDTGENRLYPAFLRQMEEHIEQKRLVNPIV